MEIEVDSNLHIVDFLQSGQSVSGLKPSVSTQGVIIPKDILVDGNTYTSKVTMPAAGLQTIGGSALAETLSVEIEGGIEISDKELLGTPTEIASSPERKAGGEYKTVSISSKGMESKAKVCIAAATIRRCGTGSCGNIE